ncbi:hypothetical protein OWR28_14710 [Chryseobacterium sp. 1B4]
MAHLQKKSAIGFSSTASVPNPYREKLVGKWLHPIAGQQRERQGFELEENGNAASVNIYTLQYNKWNVSDDTLHLWYSTEIVDLASKGIDTFLIKEIDDSEIILSPIIRSNISDTEYYYKEN